MNLATVRSFAAGSHAYGWILDAPINSVLYECNKTSIHLAVKIDPLGNGLLLDPQLVHLGSCLYSINDLQGFLHFQYRLKDCGFSRLTSGNMIEYFTDLVYRPSPGTGRRYTTSFTERINCTDYEAGHLTPMYIPSETGHLSASGVLMFTVTLMNVDFSAPSDSKIFFLGSQIHIEFSVKSSFHQPLQIFVDECTATPTPELSKSPRNYSIIANHGCLVDGKVANSQFLPRQTPEAIQLSLQAFEFVGVDSDIYLHCQVLVWDPSVLMDPTRKACSFHRDTNRWELLDSPSLSSGCSCCDSLCQATTSRHKRDLEGTTSVEKESVWGWGRMFCVVIVPDSGDLAKSGRLGLGCPFSCGAKVAFIVTWHQYSSISALVK
ncbi:unnamed protein product [Caretta caretta]